MTSALSGDGVPSSELDSGLRRTAHRRATIWLLVLGTLFINAGAVSLWMWRTFANSQGFADVMTDMLKEPTIREAVAEQIVDGLEQQSATARLSVAARPVIEEVVAEVVATEAFQGIFHAGVRQLHHGIVSGNRTNMLVEVDDAVTLVREGLELTNPSVAENIPDGALDLLVGVSQSTPASRALDAADAAGWLIAPFFVVGVGCFALAIRLALNRRSAFEALGGCLVLSGVLGFAVLASGVTVASAFGDDPKDRTALRAVFWSITHLLNIQAKVAITTGAVIAIAAANSGAGGVTVRARELKRLAVGWLERPAIRAAASLGLVVLALFAMTWPEAAGAILVRLLAFAAFVTGAVCLLDLVGSYTWTAAGTAEVRVATRRFVRGGVAAAVATGGLLMFGGLAFARAVQAPTAAHASIEETGCNGLVELCQKPMDDVVFAGTHNSMAASSEEGWLLSTQHEGILSQLGAGIRAFLLDLHYGALNHDGVVRTDLTSEGQVAHPEESESLSPEQRAAMDRAIGYAGLSPATSDSDVWLCHVMCEYGATRASEAFREIHDFLRENPNEVVLLLLDDWVSAADGMAALERGGLADRAWRWEPGAPLPTLRQMIEQRRNVVVIVERNAQGSDWYVPMFEGRVEDTPYDAGSVEEFSCDHERGRWGSSLLLVNHWIHTEPPDPLQADIANDADVLRQRVSECTTARQRVPNILAVDFFTRGDLLEVVDELNRDDAG